MEIRRREIGDIETTYDEAMKIVEKKWQMFVRALELKGDVIFKDSVEEGNIFGYSKKGYSEKYQARELSYTEEKKEIDYKRDSYYTVKTEVYKPVNKTYTRQSYYKVLKRNSRAKVCELEKKVLAKLNDYNDVKKGYSKELPKKKTSVLFNVTTFLSGVFLALFLFFSPSIISDYGHTFAADIYLYKLILGESEILFNYNFIAYITLILGIISSIASLYYCHNLNCKMSYLVVNFIATILAFAFGYCFTELFQDLVSSYNPIFLIPIGIFGLARIVCFILSYVLIILSIMRLCKNEPHKSICNAITARANQLDNFVKSGEFENVDKMIAEIKSYEINNYNYKRVMEILTKLDELNVNYRDLKNYEKREFVDKTKEINELNQRILRAKNELDSLI